MKRSTFHKVDLVGRWTTMIFAWVCWGLAIWKKSVLIAVLGFLPYLLIYNWFIRGILEKEVEPDA